MIQTKQMLNWKGPGQNVRMSLRLMMKYHIIRDICIDLFIKFPKIVCLLPACISRVNLFVL